MEFLVDCQIRLVHFEKNKMTDNRTGMECFCFGYILEGNARFEGERGTVYLEPGDLIYIPKGERYISYWETDPEIKFYSLPYEYYEKNSEEYYPLQKICGLGRKIFDDMYNAADHDPYQMISLFYRFYRDVMKSMKKSNFDNGFSKIKPAIDYLRENACRFVSVEQLASLCYMSQPSFFAEFKRITGYSPIDYKNKLRCKEVVLRLINTDETLEIISEKTGFSSPSYLRRQLKHFTGKTPKEIRKEQSLQI